MKKLIYVFMSSLCLLTLLACPVREESVDYTYIIENKTSTKVELIPYYNSVINFENKITLNIDEKKLLKKTAMNHLDGFSMPGFFLGVNPSPGTLTHIEIVFDNSKKTLYQGCSENNTCSQPKNIFNPIFSDTPTETYIITVEDYQNAVDCGGNCY